MRPRNDRDIYLQTQQLENEIEKLSEQEEIH